MLRTIPDSRKIRQAVTQASHAVIVGGGFIGLEMTENLVRRGLTVTVVDMTPQVLPPLDPEMAAFVAAHLRAQGVQLRLSSTVAAFEPRPAGGVRVCMTTGDPIEADLVILALGVQPDAALAKAAGLTLGERGGIRLDDQMHTSDPHIWAVGDVVEVRDVVTGSWQVLPLAGPASRQGRMAACRLLEHATGAGPPTAPAHRTRVARGGVSMPGERDRGGPGAPLRIVTTERSNNADLPMGPLDDPASVAIVRPGVSAGGQAPEIMDHLLGLFLSEHRGDEGGHGRADTAVLPVSIAVRRRCDQPALAHGATRDIFGQAVSHGAWLNRDTAP